VTRLLYFGSINDRFLDVLRLCRGVGDMWRYVNVAFWCIGRPFVVLL